MLSKYTLWLALSLACWCRALEPGQLTDQKRAMDLWHDPNRDGVQWTDLPTWHKTVEWDVELMGKLPSYEMALSLAASFYNWVNEQPRARTGGTSIVVAVIYNPATSRFEASTVPKGPRRAFMVDERNNAPLWKTSASSFINQDLPALCAEDGASFNLETAAPNGISGDTYPEGSFMAIWASFTSDDVVGKEYMLCHNKRSRYSIKGCQTTAETLGIAFRQKRNIQGNPVVKDPEKVPGPVPMLEPNEQPGEPWDTNELQTEDWLAVEHLLGAPTDQTPSKRSILNAMLRNSSTNNREARLQIYRKRSSAHVLVGRSASDASSESKVTSDSNGSTIWPTTITGTLVFPTSESVSTLTDTAFRTLVATGLVPGSQSIPASSSRITNAPLVSCSMQNQDPDSGISSAFCVCQGSETLPLLTPSSVTEMTQSCEYTFIPSSGGTISPHTALGPETTNSKLCQVCSLAEINENACTSMPNCIPQTIQVQATMGSSSVHLGTLTGEALYTSVSNALTSLCPTVSQTITSSQCQQTEPVKIEGVEYKNEDGTINRDGLLEVLVDTSEYNDTKILDAMINTVATSLQGAARGSNCNQTEYVVFSDKRSIPVDNGSSSFALVPRLVDPEPIPMHTTWCAAYQWYGVNFWNPYWKFQADPGITSHLYVFIKFTVPPENEVFCEVMETVTPLLAAIQPEYVAEDVVMEEDIAVSCDLSLDNYFNSNGI